ncbi:ribosomal protein S18-alanine N-acetyltransferase [Halomonas sp. HP20-15]|uniref:ribosomal protein S18-alanine N-acetyltransferase n=1 Tax=Halomonas sp. HP20-15 TaxID=3085901 RepID=UPI002982346F|nr:ribosomal protein S18-alanine N-acetyltransferase [Halomonas sp. HP20-15]MDW5376272.1 ribosomal protein S18-alanine N-acetyltransferase [Halomonas sp. HP20-15]
MTELRLSRLTPGDIDELAELERLGQPHPWREAWLSEALDDGHAECWGVHGEGGALVGHAILYRLPFEAELQAITVDPRVRRRGVARQLLERLIARAEAWGSERMLLEVRGTNHGAQALYRSMGFVVDGRRANYYPAKAGRREDALLMSRNLMVGNAGSG